MNRNHLDFGLLFWNVRGLGDSDKCDLVRNAISDANPHVACLQESKLGSLDGNKAKSFLPPNLTDFSTLLAASSRGSIVTAWNPAFLSGSSLSSGLYSLTTHFSSTTSEHAFTLTNVYAPADHRKSAAFLAELSTVAPVDGEP